MSRSLFSDLLPDDRQLATSTVELIRGSASDEFLADAQDPALLEGIANRLEGTNT